MTEILLSIPLAFGIFLLTLSVLVFRPRRRQREIARRRQREILRRSDHPWIDRAEQDYVNGDLDLAGLEQRVGQLLGLREKAPDITMAEADKRLADQAKRKFADDEWARLHVATHVTTWTASIPGSSYSPPIHDLPKVETIDLVDACGKVIRRVPKTPSKPWHLIPGG